MNKKALTNGILFTVLLAIPMVAEIITAKPNNVPGTGFDVLLYKPFDFAYVILAAVLFVVLNVYFAFLKQNTVWSGFGFGLVLLVVWFIVAFLGVGQLHLGLGGKL